MPFPTVKKRRYRNRHSRCYELSIKTMFDLADAGKSDGVVLVHGRVTVVVSGRVIDHAWLEGGGEVYDPVSDTTRPIAEYLARHQAVAERRYTLREMCDTMLEHHHEGPWHRGRIRA